MKIALGLNGFRGEQPRLEPCLLPDNRASIATMTKLQRGSLEAWRDIEIGQVLPKALGVAEPD